MDQNIKKALIDLLQKRMDKCTNEQFWAVATMSGLDAFVLIQHNLLLDVFTPWVPLLLITVPAAFASWFILRRHKAYYFYRQHLSNLLKDEDGVPEFLTSPTPRSRSNTLSGVIFYVGMVLLFWSIAFGALVYASMRTAYP